MPCLMQLLTWLHVLDNHNFGTMKDDRRSINTSASNTCFCHRNGFQNGVSPMSKMVTIFCHIELKILCISYCAIFFFKFHQHVVQIVINIVCRDFRLPMTALVMVIYINCPAWKVNFYSQFAIKTSLLLLKMLTLEV